MPAPVVAVLVAAGLGTRYGGPTPKPALRLTGRALVSLSIEAMAAGGCTHAVVVTSPDTLKHVRSALAASPIPVSITTGGSSRQESVGKGIEFIAQTPELAGTEVVLVHDAVRPMVPAHVVTAVIDAVRGGAEAVAPALPVVDSIRQVAADGSTAPVDRSSLRAIQTPQGFPYEVIRESHRRLAEGSLQVTDDLSCAEASGHTVTLVEGSRLAMKITEPTDMTVAKALWKVRTTIGHHSGRRVWRLGRRGSR